MSTNKYSITCADSYPHDLDSVDATDPSSIYKSYDVSHAPAIKYAQSRSLGASNQFSFFCTDRFPNHNEPDPTTNADANLRAIISTNGIAYTRAHDAGANKRTNNSCPDYFDHNSDYNNSPVKL